MSGIIKQVNQIYESLQLAILALAQAGLCACLKCYMRLRSALCSIRLYVYYIRFFTAA